MSDSNLRSVLETITSLGVQQEEGRLQNKRDKLEEAVQRSQNIIGSVTSLESEGRIQAAGEDAGVGSFEASNKGVESSETALRAALQRGRRSYSEDANVERSGLERALDFGGLAATEVVALVPSLGSVIAGFSGDKRASADLAGYAEDVREGFNNNFRSDAGNRRSDALNDRVAAIKIENRKIKEEGIANEIVKKEGVSKEDALARARFQFGIEEEKEKSFFEEMKEITRNFVDTLGAADIENVIDISGQGVGSLLGGGATTGLIRTAGLGAAKLLGKATIKEGGRGLISQGANEAIRRVGASAAVPLGVGVQEGIFGYTEVVNEVANMSFEKLMSGSLEFNEITQDLVSQGIPEEEAMEEARLHIAYEAGKQAGGTRAAIGAVIAKVTGVSKLEDIGGKVWSRFTSRVKEAENAGAAAGKVDDVARVATPVKPDVPEAPRTPDAPEAPKSPMIKTLREIGFDFIKEGTEESLQEGLGQVASNVAIAEFADANRQWNENVGENAALGAIGGIGVSGVINSKSIAAQTAMAPFRAVGAVGKIAGARGAKLREEAANKEAARNDANLAEVRNLNRGEARAAREEEFAASDATPEQKDKARAAFDEFESKIAITDEDRQEKDPLAQEILGSSANKVDAIERAIEIANDETRPEEDRASAYLFASEMIKKVDADLDVPFSATDDKNPLLAKLQEYDSSIKSYVGRFKEEGIERTGEAVNKALSENPEQFRSVDPTSAEGVKKIAQIIRATKERPESANPELNDIILEHAENGKVNLTPSEKSSLQSSSGVKRAEQEANEKRKSLGIRRGVKLGSTLSGTVGDNIRTGENQKGQYSISQYTQKIGELISTGNVEGAKVLLGEMKQFAELQGRKVGALNDNFRKYKGNGKDKNAIKYQNLTANRELIESEKGLFVNKAPNSIKNAQEIAVDADFVADSFNALADAYPELGVSKVEKTKLDLGLDQNADAISKDLKSGKIRATEGQNKSAPAPVETKTNEAVSQENSDEVSVDMSTLMDEPSEQNEDSAKAENNEPTRFTVKSPSGSPGATHEAEVERTDDGRVFVYETQADGTTRRIEVAPSRRSLGNKELVAATLMSKEVNEITDNDAAPKVAAAPEVSSPTPAAAKPQGSARDSNLRNFEEDEVFSGTAKKTVAEENTSDNTLATETTEADNAQPEGGDQEVDAESTTEASQEETPAQELEGISKDPEEFSQAYSNLLENKKAGIFNKFKAALVQSKNSKSRLLRMVSPLAVLVKITDPAFYSALTGENVDLPQSVLEAYKDINVVMLTLKERLEERLKDQLATPAGKVFANGKTSSSKNGKPYSLNEMINGLNLNIVEQDADGNLVYNERLIDAAIAAATQWLIESKVNGGSKVEDDSINKMLGIELDLMNPEDADGIRAYMREMVLTKKAVDNIANAIMQFWGVDPKNSEAEGFTRGIAEAIARDIVESMLEKDMAIMEKFVWERVKVTLKDGTSYTEERRYNSNNKNKANEEVLKANTFSFISSNKNNEFLESALVGVRSYPSAINSVMLEGGKPVRHIGRAPEKVAKTQKGNKNAKLKERQQEMLNNAQNEEYSADIGMIEMTLKMGKDLVVSLFGMDTSGNLNVNTKRSREGFNTTFSGAYDEIVALYEELKIKAAEGSLKPADMKIFYEYFIPVQNRLHMKGGYNPQSNKLIREMVLPTWSTLNFTDMRRSVVIEENEQTTDSDGNIVNSKRNVTVSNDALNFYLAIAQHLGIKVHKISKIEAYQEVSKLLKGSLAESIGIILDSQSDPDFVWNQQNIDVIKNGLEALDHRTPAAFHSLVEYARSLTASDQGKFKTSLYIEMDGITDGVMHALIALGTGPFTRDTIFNLMKGGMYLGNGVGTFAEFLKKYGKNGKLADFYEEVANTTSRFIRDMVGASSPEVVQATEDLYNLMSDLGMKIKISPHKDGGYDIIIDRGVTKNPVTVTMYGSGIQGIADKIVKEIVDQFYEKLSDNPKAPMSPETIQRMERMLGITVVSGKNGVAVTNSKPFKIQMDQRLTLTFTKDQLKGINSAVMSLLVKPMKKGMDIALQDIDAGKKAMFKSTQIQTIMAKAEFEKRVSALFALKETRSEALMEKFKADPESLTEGETTELRWRESQAFTGVEMDQIFNDIYDIYPFADLTDQNILLGGKSKAVVVRDKNGKKKNINISAASTGRITSSYEIPTPQSAGVSGLAITVQSSGDAATTMNIFTGEGYLRKALPVHDGINVPIADLDASSQRVNEGVHETWTTNPLLGSLSAMLDQIQITELAETLRTMSDVDKIALTKALFEGVSEGYIAPDKEIIGAIENVRNEMRELGRQNAARSKALARFSATNDHLSSGHAPYVKEGEFAGETVEEQVAALEKAYNEEMEQSAPVVSNDQVIPAEQIESRVKTNKFNLVQKRLFDWAKKALDGKGWNFFIGSRKEAAKYAADLGLTINPGGKTKGLAAPGIKTIFIFSNNPETIVHEMIHAATLSSVVDFFTNRESLPLVVRQAIQRIVDLMEIWEANVDYSGLTEDEKFAIENAKAAIAKAKEGGTPVDMAVAVNEFMAWNLANNHLRRVNRKIKSPALSKMADIVTKVIKAIKDMLGLPNVESVEANLFSILEGNTRIVMSYNKPSDSSRIANVLEHTEAFGSSEANKAMASMFDAKITNKIKGFKPDSLWEKQAELKATIAQNQAGEVADAMIASGFAMDEGQEALFKSIVAAYTASADLDPNVLIEIRGLYDSIMDQLDPTALAGGTDAVTANPNLLKAAEKKYAALIGKATGLEGKDKKSALMIGLMALVAVDEDLRAAVNKLDIKKPKGKTEMTTDGLLNAAGETMINSLGKFFARTGRTSDNSDKIEALLERLAKISNDVSPVGQGVKMGGTLVDKGNEITREFLQKISNMTYDELMEISKNTDNKMLSNLAAAMAFVVGVTSDKRAEAVKETALAGAAAADRLGWKAVKELIAEIIGRTESNASIFDKIKVVRAFVDKVRQQFREVVPNVIAEKFSRKLSKVEWENMFDVMFKSDIASILSGMTLQDLSKILKDRNELNNRISDYEAAALQAGATPEMLARARQLGKFLVDGKFTHNLGRNAFMIASNINIRSSKKSDENNGPLVKAIDQLASAYALAEMDQDRKNAVANLIDTENQGMQFIAASLKKRHEEESAKLETSVRGKINHIKGAGFSGRPLKNALIIRKAKDRKEMELLGYKFEGYHTDTNYAYYIAPSSHRARYFQGLMQNVRPLVYGVDARNGFVWDGLAEGQSDDTITDMNEIQKMISRGLDDFIPIYNNQFQVIALQRAVDPSMREKSPTEKEMHKALGIWQGRNFEESVAEEINKDTVTKIKEMWDKNKNKGRDADYIDIFDPKEWEKDPTLQDGVSILTPATIEEIKQQFGTVKMPDGSDRPVMMVHRTLANDTIGFRSASIGDFWTGSSRRDPKTDETIKNALIGIIGLKAFSYLTNAEKWTQAFVSDAKRTIVIKSVVVPAINTASNVIHLYARGVPMLDIITKIPKKLHEAETYMKDQRRVMELKAELDVETQKSKKDLIQRKIDAIEDSHKKMSIWPLIERGEMSTLTDAGDIQEDGLGELLYKGKFGEYIELLVDKAPNSVKTAARYGVISQDTALYKGLQKATIYGDFIAKAILYDDIVHRQSKLGGNERLQAAVEAGSEALNDYAAQRISSEFVHYDRLTGRTRAYAESIGLTWFWHFKLRSMKVALSILRDNPLHFLLSQALPGAADIGTAVTDNFAAVTMDGRLFNSIGPDQAFRAHTLLPISQIGGSVM